MHKKFISITCKMNACTIVTRFAQDSHVCTQIEIHSILPWATTGVIYSYTQ